MNYIGISVIVPIRDASNYLQNTLELLSELSFPSWELIIVDDGSKDSTSLILQEWANTTNLNYTVIRNPKSVGVASARNLAVEKAAGEYVWFADGDDSWHADILEHLWSGVFNQSVDMVVCDAEKMIEQSGHRSGIIDAPYREAITGSDALKRVLLGNLQGHLWNKLIRTDLLRKYPFPSLRAHSDLAGVLRYAAESRIVSTVPGVKYQYNVHYGSIIQSSNYKWHTLVDCMKIAKELVESQLSRSDALDELEIFKYANVMVPAMNSIAMNVCPNVNEIPYKKDVTLVSLFRLLRKNRPMLAVRIAVIRYAPGLYMNLYRRYYATRWGIM